MIVQVILYEYDFFAEIVDRKQNRDNDWTVSYAANFLKVVFGGVVKK